MQMKLKVMMMILCGVMVGMLACTECGSSTTEENTTESTTESTTAATVLLRRNKIQKEAAEKHWLFIIPQQKYVWQKS